MLYFIATRINNLEHLVLADTMHSGPLCFSSLEAAKLPFQPFYDILRLASVNSVQYEYVFKKLALIRPIIIGLNMERKQAIKLINNKVQSDITYKPQFPIVLNPHLLAPLTLGTINSFQQLDVFEDITRITRIDAQGNIEVIHTEVKYVEKGAAKLQPTRTEEDIKEILRQKGYI
jgi:hypothetical protein